MHYEGTVIRPPSEANSIILQVTVGCSHNRCTFCGAYKDVCFKIKAEDVVDEDIDFAARYCTRQKRVFLADGDVLILSQKRLVHIFTKIGQRLPWVNRINLYGNAKAILSKSVEELQALKKLGLNRIYMGLESGDDQVLSAINKGAHSEKMILAAKRAREAGLFLSVTVLLGIGGKEKSRIHAQATARTLSKMAPNQIAALTLMVMDNTPLFLQQQQGDFDLPDSTMMLQELKEMVLNIEVGRCQLQANHASNYLAINCRLPRDKEQVVAELNEAIAGQRSLKPEYLRAL